MSEAGIEKEIQAKGLTARRLTPELIDEAIVGEDYHVFGETCLTVCCLLLVNGFTVTGESACASPENFDADIGKSIARENARNKIWMLEGYLLKQELYMEKMISQHQEVWAEGDVPTTAPASVLERVTAERDDLKGNYYKLGTFLSCGDAGKVSGTHLALMQEQHRFMGCYGSILDYRIADLMATDEEEGK